MPQQPADDPAAQAHRMGYGGPPLDPPPLPPRWGRAKEAARHYGVGITKIYDWLNSGRFITRKVDGVRLLLIGAARGIDIDEGPPPGAIPVSKRPENVGKTFRGGRKRQTETPPDAFLTSLPGGVA